MFCIFIERDHLGFTLLEIFLHPVVLEGITIWIKSLRLRDDLHFLVVIWSSSIGDDDCFFKVGMFEVGSSKLLNTNGCSLGLILLFLA